MIAAYGDHTLEIDLGGFCDFRLQFDVVYSHEGKPMGPDSFIYLQRYCTDDKEWVTIAEFMDQVALKCLGESVCANFLEYIYKSN